MSQGSKLSSSLRTQGPITPGLKTEKGLGSSAGTRVRAAAMSAIALTLGSLRSQGRLIENSICDSPAQSDGLLVPCRAADLERFLTQ